MSGPAGGRGGDRRRRVARLALLAPLLLAAGWLLIGVCADGGAMAARYRECDCRGLELTAYDRTAADGPRRTICLGLRSAPRCYAFREGPERPCP